MVQYFRANFIEEPDDRVVHRNSIGGHPILAENQEWPICGQTGEKMVLFLQFDIEDRFGLPFPSGSHLCIFMSPKINGIPYFMGSDVNGKLPSEFWSNYLQHTFVCFNKVPYKEQIHGCDPYLIQKQIVFMPLVLNDDQDPKCEYIFLGGEPIWQTGSDDTPFGPDGERMTFIGQISTDFSFTKRQNAPEQPDSFSSNDYCLYLGNHIYIFGSPLQTDPRAVWIEVQN